MFLKNKNFFLFSFYDDYWKYKLDNYKKEDIPLDFLDMTVNEDLFNETTFSVFLNFNSIKIYNNFHPINYQLFIIGFFLKEKREKKILTFDIGSSSNYHYNLQHFNDPAQIKTSCMYHFYNETKDLLGSDLNKNLINFSQNFFKILFKKLEVIGSKIEYSRNINVLSKNFNKSRFKIDIYVCNSVIKEFPFWDYLINYLDYKLKIDYNRSDNKFSKLSFKYENSYINFINYHTNYYFSPTDKHYICRTLSDYSLNYDIYIKEEVRFLYLYLENWFLIVLFFKKNIKFIIDKENYFKKIYLEEFPSLKSYAWFLFNKYLINKNYSFRNKFTIEEYDVFTNSLFFGIQTIENYNDLDLPLIYSNIDKINHWDDLLNYSNNTLEMYEYDINGAFSYAACNSQFSNEGYFHPISNLSELTNKVGFCFVIIEDDNVSNNYYIPVKDLISKQVHYNCFGRIFGWYYIDEILQLSEYCNITPLYAYYYEKPQYILKDFVYSLKDLERLNINNKKFIKIMLNSVFGMFGYKNKVNTVNLNKNLKETPIGRIYKKIYLKDSENKELILTLAENDLPTKSKYFFINSIINAKNRIRLREFLFDIKKRNGILGIVNIDSFWTNLVLDIKENEIMGELKIKNFKKKILFINQNSFINFTDKYFQYNNKKIYDIFEIKKLLLKLEHKNKIKNKSKININFLDSFSNIAVLKKYISTGGLKLYNKLDDNLKNLIRLNESFSCFEYILDFINNNQPENFKDKLKNNFNKYINFNYKITLYLYIDTELIHQFNYSITLKSKNNNQQMLSLYEKFDYILYHWFENYSENKYKISMNLSYDFGDEILISQDFILKGIH